MLKESAMKEKYVLSQKPNLTPKDSVVFSYVEKIVFNLNKVYDLKSDCESSLNIVYCLLKRVLEEQSFAKKQMLLQEVMHNLKILNRDETLNRSTYKICMLAHKKSIISNYVNNKKIQMEDSLLLAVQDAIKINQTLLDTIEYMNSIQYDV